MHTVAITRSPFNMSCSPLTLLVLLLLTAQAYAATWIPPYNTSTPVTLAVLWPADPVTGFNVVSLPISLALAGIQAQGGILPTTLIVSYTDSTISGQASTLAALNALNSSSTIALLGTNDTFNSVAVSTVARAATTVRPIFQTQSTATSLTISSSIIRTSYTVSSYGAVFNLLLQRYNWTTFSLIHTIDADSYDIVSYMISSVAVGNVSMYTYAVSNIDEVAAPAITSALERIQRSQLQIVIVHGVQSINVMIQAYARGMLDAPMTWIGTDWCTQSAINTLLAAGVDLTGLVCIGGANPAPDSWSTFAQQLSSMDPVTFPSPELVPLTAGFAYDAVWVLALAMQAQQTANKTLALWNAAIAVKSTGVTGPISFPSNSGDRVSQLTLYNFDPSSNSLITVGNWNASKTTILSITGSILWSGGSTVPHRDLGGEYTQGESLPTGQDSRLQLLAYSMCVLGSWTTLILLEQAVSARRMQLHISNRQLPTNTKSTRRFYRIWIGWCAIAAIAFGLCSLWQVQALGLFALQTDAGDVVLDSAMLFPPALMAIGLSFVSFALVLTNTSLIATGEEESETSRHSSHPSSLKPGAVDSVVRASQTSKVVPSTTAQQSESSTTGEHRGGRRVHALRLKRNLFSLIDPRMALAAILISLCTVLLHYINMTTVHGPFQLNQDSSSLIISAIVTVFTCWLPLWAFFHFHQSAARFLAAFAMGAALWGADQLCQLGESYTFDGTPAYGGSSGDISMMTTSALVIAVIACVVCLALLVFNVLTLQLSAKVLARKQAEVSASLLQLQEQLEQCHTETALLKDEAHAAGQQIELISYCRPVYREYAAVLALAEAAPVVDANVTAARDGSVAGSVAIPSKTVNSLPTLTLSTQRDSLSSDRVRRTTVVLSSHVLEGSRVERGGMIESTKSSVIFDWTSGPNQAWPFALLASGFVSPSSLWPVKDENAIARLCLPSPAQSSIPSSVSMLKQVELTTILRHPVLLEILKDSAVASFTPESVMFWSDLMQFNQLTSLPSIVAAAKQLYSEYVEAGSPYEVNISASQREDLKHQIVDAVSLGTESGLFKSVEMEMIKLITTNQLSQFFSSPLASVAALALTAAPTLSSSPTSPANANGRVSVANHRPTQTLSTNSNVNRSSQIAASIPTGGSRPRITIGDSESPVPRKSNRWVMPTDDDPVSAEE